MASPACVAKMENSRRSSSVKNGAAARRRMHSTPWTAPSSFFIGMQIEEETSGTLWTADPTEPGVVGQRVQQQRLARLDHAARDAAADEDPGVLHHVVGQAV